MRLVSSISSAPSAAPVGMLLALVLAGCSTARRHGPTWGTLARPGDESRASVLPPRRGDPLPTPTADPLPALAPGEWRAESAGPFRPPRAGDAVSVRPGLVRPSALSPWRIRNGDLALPLDRAWQLRLGLGAGGVPLDDAPDLHRRARMLTPGVCLECDL
jgi:hypothetical protein